MSSSGTPSTIASETVAGRLRCERTQDVRFNLVAVCYRTVAGGFRVNSLFIGRNTAHCASLAGRGDEP